MAGTKQQWYQTNHVVQETRINYTVYTPFIDKSKYNMESQQHGKEGMQLGFTSGGAQSNANTRCFFVTRVTGGTTGENEQNGNDVNLVVRASSLSIKLTFRPSPYLKSLPTSNRIQKEMWLK